MAIADHAATLPAAPGVADTREERGTVIVPGIHCAGCIARVEHLLRDTPGVTHARVNLTEKLASVAWHADEISLDRIIDVLKSAGYAARPLARFDRRRGEADAERRQLLRALAVAGFAAGNVMLLSVSVWSGAEAATRDLLHWISALIALPAMVYAGQPFFASAAMALRGLRLNMDVPISLALVLASAMSFYETMTGGEHVYFDAACMLAFFLLAGRTLDHMMRARARSAVTELVALQPETAEVEDASGARREVETHELAPGMTVLLAAGERAPADGRVVSGTSDLDRSLITGEADPIAVGPGVAIEAGTINLTGPLKIEVTAAGDETTLARIARLMEEAEQARARYLRIADRAARIYAPLVHLAALATFLAWLWASGDWHLSLMTAIAVLIITCPCALALAVPAVQVVACGRLFQSGIMVKNGAALERLAEIDTAIFDKTGTLTLGRPALGDIDGISEAELAIALGLARHSRHPLARALSETLDERGIAPALVEDATEVPGFGLSSLSEGREVRLGSRDWCGCAGDNNCETAHGPEIMLRVGDGAPGRFGFTDALRPDAADTVEALRARGFSVVLLSGDRAQTVRDVAEAIGISEFHAAQKPDDKAAFIRAAEDAGHRVLMVGDGINDAPALGLAHASMAPSTAADISGTAADLVFMGRKLTAIVTALDTASQARLLVGQNFALAILYNLIAVPIAAAGLASPLLAAVAMSASSLAVTANAMRLRMAGTTMRETTA